ncbi:DUF1707 SHOCT-like domain-containing protein [Rhodococcus gannanensis]|uniref:DUF1707 domain-containing protein n=1 Tax=Rhodococcus gannanensis TaxID=1960308 RepID=A0ABW4NYV4_9NOCA
MAELPDTRIGTFEREQAIELLTRHLGEGRLSFTEFEDRCARVETARTNHDLAILFVDLPALGGPAAAGRRFGWILLPVVLIAGYFAFAAADLALWFIPIALVLVAGSALLYAGTRRRRPRVPDFLRAAAPDLPAPVATRAPTRFGLVPYALILLAPALMLRQPVVVLAAAAFLIFAVVRGIE